MPPLEPLDGIEPLIEAYDGFLLDQFGVLHNGERAYPSAIEALALIRSAGHKIIILSNSGKRSDVNRDRLDDLGITADLYDDLLTSGEVAWLGLQGRTDLTFAGLGEVCLFVSRGGDCSAIEDLPFAITEDAARADFVYLSGLDGAASVRRELDRQFTMALERGLPLLCSNPDMISLEGELRLPGPGAVAARYAELGGDVRYVGKPWPAIYRAALQRLNMRVDRIVAIGDSLDHDIKGAQSFGIDGALITSGVHREALWAGACRGAVIRRLAEEAGASPRWYLEHFAPTP